VLVCYLDDSGKDPQNRITTLAGYVADADDWLRFEDDVEPLFSEYKVPILHAKDLHNTDDAFKGWKVIKKQSFTFKICRKMSAYVPLGMSVSALKENYPTKAVLPHNKGRRISTQYTFCFNVILDWVLGSVAIGKVANRDGVAFILECGHENNPDAERFFWEIRKQHGLENVLRSISFVPKEHCRAIQMADLLAFYTRRQGEAAFKAPLEERDRGIRPSQMMNIIASSVPTRAFVSTGWSERERE
jgi:hypothetical protein